MKRKLKALFSNLCCSVCKHGFDEDSIQIKREEKGCLLLISFAKIAVKILV